jgi:hypothetical protein
MFAQIRSDLNRKRAEKPMYPYNRGRRGYALLEQDIVSIYIYIYIYI